MRLSLSGAAALLSAVVALTACSNDAAVSLTSVRTGPKSLGGIDQSAAATHAATVSPSGTTVPPATDIVDDHHDVWAISTTGTALRDSLPAATSVGVTQLLYQDSVIYQHNIYNAWWSWKDGNWVLAKDPRVALPRERASASPSGSNIPDASSIVDGNGDQWTVVGGAVMKNGGPAATSVGVKLLLYYENVIYQYNMYGAWWSWNGRDWVLAKDPRSAQLAAREADSPSVSGATIPALSKIVDRNGDVWTVAAGVVLRNDKPAATSVGVELLLYFHDVIYQYNIYRAWWSWNGSNWVLSADPRNAAETHTSKHGHKIPS